MCIKKVNNGMASYYAKNTQTKVKPVVLVEISHAETKWVLNNIRPCTRIIV